MMKKTRMLSMRDGEWMPMEVLAPGAHIYREDPRPYEIPTNRPWNAPIPCPVPTYEGTGLTVHPSVVDFQSEPSTTGSFNGYRFWMAHTPYANGDGWRENPSIVASNNGWDWHDPYGIVNPVVVEPFPRSDYYNADNDLVWNPEESRLEMVWKHQPSNASTTHYRHKYSYDGITWSEEALVEVTPGSTRPGWGWVSPAMVRLSPNQWIIVFVVYAGSGNTLRTFTASTPAGPWEGPTQGTDNAPLIEGENLWHSDVILDDDGTFWMLVSSHDDRTAIYPARSSDGVNWKFGAPVLHDEPEAPDTYKYRPTFAFHENGTHMRVWYSSMRPQRIWYTEIPLSEWPSL